MLSVNSKGGAVQLDAQDVAAVPLPAQPLPGEVVRIDGERVDDLDQINLPDPVMNAIQQNEAKINALQAEIEKLKEQLK